MRIFKPCPNICYQLTNVIPWCLYHVYCLQYIRIHCALCLHPHISVIIFIGWSGQYIISRQIMVKLFFQLKHMKQVSTSTPPLELRNLTIHLYLDAFMGAENSTFDTPPRSDPVHNQMLRPLPSSTLLFLWACTVRFGSSVPYHLSGERQL
jgi:hypothetical protein